jgi:hypothetical protein
VARSDYIYIVLKDMLGTPPVAAFTVKHELLYWLRQRTEAELAGHDVYRCKDEGWNMPHKPPVKLDIEELLK